MFLREMDDLRVAWAQRLRRARLDKGMTQHQLAVAAGFTQTRISNWESGGMVPRDAARIALADALGLRVNEIFAYPGDAETAEVA